MPAKRTPKPLPPPAPTPLSGKLGTIAALLQRLDGASIAQLVEATGWQSHSVRGAMAGALKKRGFTVASEKLDGVRVYRLPPAVEANP